MNSKVAILSAGEGKRFRPYSYLHPKSLCTINGIPIIGHLIERVKNVGIGEEDICVIVGDHHENEIRGFVNHYYQKVSCIKQKEGYGTAIGMLSAEEFVEDSLCTFLYGDIYFQDNLEILRSKFPTICVMKRNVREFGEVKRIGPYIEILEKQNMDREGLVFAGILANMPPIFFDYLSEVRPDEKTGEYYATDAISEFSKDFEVEIYELKGFWFDVGRGEDLIKARNFGR